MSEQRAGYVMKPAALKAIAEKKAELLRYRELHLITSDQVWKQFIEFLSGMVYAARMEASDQALFCVLCRDCGRSHTMNVDVKYYRCLCSPRQDRPTSMHQRPLA